MKSAKFLIIGLILIAIALTVWFLIKISNAKRAEREAELAKALADAAAAKKQTSESREVIKTVYIDNPDSLDFNITLKKGSVNNSEVKALQSLLGVTQDGIFGSQTEAALYSMFGVKQVTLNGAIQMRAAAGTSGSANSGPKDQTGKAIDNGDRAWTQSPQTIYKLIPQRAFTPIVDQPKYDDFKIGQEFRAGANFDLGVVFDHTDSAVLCIKPGNKDTLTQYFFAYNNQVTVVKK